MKRQSTIRVLSLLLCLALCLSLLGGLSVFAADEIWTEPPTGWRHSSHVIYKTQDGYTLNWGVRGEPALFLSGDALSYYSDNEWGVGRSWGWFVMEDYDGGSGAEDAASSPLYCFLHDFLAGKQSHVTSYDETLDLYKYTDCMVNNCDFISSFYSGRKLNGAWDSGATWNREHTWPNSKCTAPMEDDIMMLRPTSVQENSDRGNLAYGESAGFYNPNAEANGQFDLRGDCARICLYCYVRWSENAPQMWGASGVMESLDVLLKWNALDPVDTWEMGRNDAVESITGVRNCFVDYPELAWALFGQDCPYDFPTPMAGGGEWPPASAIMTEYRAVPDDPAHGSVDVYGLCAKPQPAEGYYASGYDVLSAGPWYLDPDAENPYDNLLRWDHGRLLCMCEWELEVSVMIHFTPVGQTDPCPTGHDLDLEHAEILEAPTCTENGIGLATCSRCGAKRQIVLESLGHDWDDGVVIRPATLDEWGLRVYQCKRCGETWEDEFLFEFDDVKDHDKYYYDSVFWALYHEPRITSGVDNAHFGPKRNCTREQIVTFLWKAAGAPEPQAAECAFTDVTSGKYYYKAVLWAVENKITSGVSSTLFGVGKPCTREQAMTFLWKACGSPEPDSSDSPFSDVTLNKYYYKPILWAAEHGITSGVSSTQFGVGKTCTRAQIVTFLYNASYFLNCEE